MNALRSEWRRAVSAFQSLDRQTMFVLTLAPILVIIQFNLGSRRFFRNSIAPDLVPDHLIGLTSWGWWFGMQGILGFVIPVLCLLFIFKRKPAEIGLGLGDWKLASLLAGAYIPLVVIGTWFLSSQRSFLAQYPHLQSAAYNWDDFIIYELLFLFYWFGWEYLWRGFVLFGTAHKLGLYAIFIQSVPFAILHIEKPIPEALLSVLGGIALGALVWRCRSFWIAIPIHAAQMLILDLWCSLRLRTGINGVGFGDMWKIFEKL